MCVARVDLFGLSWLAGEIDAVFACSYRGDRPLRRRTHVEWEVRATLRVLARAFGAKTPFSTPSCHARVPGTALASFWPSPTFGASGAARYRYGARRQRSRQIERHHLDRALARTRAGLDTRLNAAQSGVDTADARASSRAGGGSHKVIADVRRSSGFLTLTTASCRAQSVIRCSYVVLPAPVSFLRFASSCGGRSSGARHAALAPG